MALALPAAAAVAVFGTLYGAAARGCLGVPLTIASSLLVYSGALQFAMVARPPCWADARPHRWAGQAPITCRRIASSPMW